MRIHSCSCSYSELWYDYSKKYGCWELWKIIVTLGFPSLLKIFLYTPIKYSFVPDLKKWINMWGNQVSYWLGTTVQRSLSLSRASVMQGKHMHGTPKWISKSCTGSWGRLQPRVHYLSASQPSQGVNWQRSSGNKLGYHLTQDCHPAHGFQKEQVTFVGTS